MEIHNKLSLIAHCGVRNSIRRSVKTQTVPFEVYSATFKYGGKDYVDTLKGRLAFVIGVYPGFVL
jgi:hypothetical protein